jgi:hypothetical protein
MCERCWNAAPTALIVLLLLGAAAWGQDQADRQQGLQAMVEAHSAQVAQQLHLTLNPVWPARGVGPTRRMRGCLALAAADPAGAGPAPAATGGEAGQGE